MTLPRPRPGPDRRPPAGVPGGAPPPHSPLPVPPSPFPPPPWGTDPADLGGGARATAAGRGAGGMRARARARAAAGAGAAVAALLAGGAAADDLFVHGGGACRVSFNATGHPQGVVLSQAAVTESFADRPLRTATSLASAWYAEDFSREFSDERNFTAPNLAVMGWTKKQPTYVAAYATRVQWDAGRRELSYDLEQSPEQAGTQSLGGRRAAQAAREGGSAKLRKCAIFVDGGHGCTCGDYSPHD